MAVGTAPIGRANARIDGGGAPTGITDACDTTAAIKHRPELNRPTCPEDAKTRAYCKIGLK